MKHPKTKFHAQTMSNSQVIMSKKVNLSLGQIYLAPQFFYHQYFIQITTTEFDMFLQFLVQFCNYSGFVAISDCGECMITLSLARSGACNLAILNCAPVFAPRLLRCACGPGMQYCQVFF